MRHRKEKRPLGRTSSHRDALLRNLVTSLIDKGRITTTLEKAKELRRLADRMVTLGKRGDLAARRRAAATVRSAAAVKKLFGEVALWSESRPGGSRKRGNPEVQQRLHDPELGHRQVVRREVRVDPRPQGVGRALQLDERVERPDLLGGSAVT